MMHKSHEGTGNQAGGTKVVITPIENEDLNDDDGTEVYLSDEPAFRYGFDEDDEEVQKQGNNVDF